MWGGGDREDLSEAKRHTCKALLWKVRRRPRRTPGIVLLSPVLRWARVWEFGFPWCEPLKSRAPGLFTVVLHVALRRRPAGPVSASAFFQGAHWHVGRGGCVLVTFESLLRFVITPTVICNYLTIRLSPNIQSMSIIIPSGCFKGLNSTSRNFFFQQIKGTYFLGCFPATLI